MLHIKNHLLNLFIRIFLPKSNVSLEKGFILEAINFWRLTSKYNASHHTDEDREKMQYTLLRENHVIEKGMSMRNPRKGFGQEKVNSLLDRLQKYLVMYGDSDREFMRYPLSTIKNYILYTEERGTPIPEIKDKYNKLEKETNLGVIITHAGIVETTKEEVLSKCNKDFESLLLSRHSLRYFSEESVKQETIIKALQFAQRTPSACNRQGWKTHVYQGEKSIELIKWQGGSRGFEDECRYTILVTANLKAFLSHEVHQAYIDGGLYAMNLINALHSLGLGCIPLSCGFEYSKLRKLDQFGIPENEVPIVIIAFGNLQDKFNVAVSTRKDICKTNTFHK